MAHVALGGSARPQPVRIMAVVLAVLGFLTGAAGLGDLISATAMAWLIIANGALTVGWGAWVAGQVTPLSAPQAADGRALVPTGTPPPAAANIRGDGGSVDVMRLLLIIVAVAVVVWLLTWLF